jgi:hypothetical protein
MIDSIVVFPAPLGPTSPYTHFAQPTARATLSHGDEPACRGEPDLSLVEHGLGFC